MYMTSSAAIIWNMASGKGFSPWSDFFLIPYTKINKSRHSRVETETALDVGWWSADFADVGPTLGQHWLTNHYSG